MPSFPLIFAPR